MYLSFSSYIVHIGSAERWEPFRRTKSCYLLSVHSCIIYTPYCTDTIRENLFACWIATDTTFVMWNLVVENLHCRRYYYSFYFKYRFQLLVVMNLCLWILSRLLKNHWSKQSLFVLISMHFPIPMDVKINLTIRKKYFKKIMMNCIVCMSGRVN